MTILADLSWDNLVLGLGVGLSCLGAQKLLDFLLSRTPGFWSKQPTFVAHQIVAFPLMLYVASVGCAAWFSPRPADHGFPDERIFGHDATGSHLAIVLLGALLIWDIPLTLDPSIYSAASMGHHVGLAALALLSLRPFVQYCAPRHSANATAGPTAAPALTPTPPRPQTRPSSSASPSSRRCRCRSSTSSTQTTFPS